MLCWSPYLGPALAPQVIVKYFSFPCHRRYSVYCVDFSSFPLLPLINRQRLTRYGVRSTTLFKTLHVMAPFSVTSHISYSFLCSLNKRWTNIYKSSRWRLTTSSLCPIPESNRNSPRDDQLIQTAFKFVAHLCLAKFVLVFLWSSRMKTKKMGCGRGQGKRGGGAGIGNEREVRRT